MPENNYSLKFSTKASEDLEQIYIYIAEKLFANVAADRLLNKIEDSINNNRYKCKLYCVIIEILLNYNYSLFALELLL